MKMGGVVVAHAFNPSTWDAEAGGFLSLKPDWSTEWDPGQPGLYRETLSQKQNKTKQKTKNKKQKTKTTTTSKTYGNWETWNVCK